MPGSCVDKTTTPRCGFRDLRRRRFDGFHFERSPFHRCGLNLLWFHNRRIRFSHKHPQIEFPSRQRLWRSLDHVESKCYGSTNETIECCETETQIGCGRRTGRNPPDVTRAGSSRQQHPDRLVSRCFDRWIGLVTRARAASGKILGLSPKRNKNAWTGPIYLIGRCSANEGVVTDIAIFPRRRRRRRKCAGARR